MTQPQVELLFWDGCPSHPQALDELRAAMTELGLDPDQVLVREVDTDRLADRERFVGSPRIRATSRWPSPAASTIAATAASPPFPTRPTCATPSATR
jgi:hypothetical protein